MWLSTRLGAPLNRGSAVASGGSASTTSSAPLTEPPGAKGVAQGGLVHDAASGRVDQDRVLWQQRQGGGVQQVVGATVGGTWMLSASTL